MSALQMGWFGLARRPGHVASGQDMKMKVEDTLTSLFADIGNHAVAIQIKFFGHVSDDSEDVADDSGVALIHGGDGSDVCLGNYQKMGRGLRVDVIECVAQLVLIYLVGGDVAGDDLTE